MPADTLAPPAAPSPNIVSAPSPGPKASVPQIPAQMTAASVAPPVEPSAPPKPGSAKARMFEELKKRGKSANTGFEPRDPEPVVEPPKADENPPQVNPEEQADPDAPKIDEPEAPKPGDPVEPDRAKTNKPTKDFWRAFDTWKKRATEAEVRLAEVSKGILPENDRKVIEERVSKAEARSRELEEHIAFVDFQKSEKFQTEYQKPYEQAWDRAMSEIGQISVMDSQTQEARAATAQDMLALVNLPLGDARAMANQVFGDFADDVMAYRKEIRSLFDKQNAALADAKTNAVTRQKEMFEGQQKLMSDMTNFIVSTYKGANDAITKDPTFGSLFTPEDGDVEGNTRLEKGYKLVDQAFSEDPRDPKLSPEQRAEIVKRHAAMRNRAAVFGKLIYKLKKSEAAIAALKKELDGYKGSAPTTTGRTAGSAAAAPEQRGMAGLKASLQRIARPGA